MPHLADPEFNRLLVLDSNKYTFGRWGKRFGQGDLPAAFESFDWRLNHQGRHPRFWAYVKHSACHWLVNPSLRLAALVEPKRPWRIVSSQDHSTVWDKANTLFDMNGAALMQADDAFGAADQHRLGVEEYLRVYPAQHFSTAA